MLNSLTNEGFLGNDRAGDRAKTVAFSSRSPSATSGPLSRWLRPDPDIACYEIVALDAVTLQNPNESGPADRCVGGFGASGEWSPLAAGYTRSPI